MATLSRRQDDGGFYIRTGRGYFGTKQVHPDAVRYLNRHDVYMGDPIPSRLMEALSSKPGWLFTKEEHPHVTFFEFSDPGFGRRSTSRSAVQGTTRVVSVSASPGRRTSQAAISSTLPPSTAQRKKEKNKKRRSQRVELNPGSWSDPLPGSAVSPTPRKRKTLSLEEKYQKATKELERAKEEKAKLDQEIAAFEQKQGNAVEHATSIHGFSAERNTLGSMPSMTMLTSDGLKDTAIGISELIGRVLGRAYRGVLGSERSWIILAAVLFVVGVLLLDWIIG